ncbi:hypothetical protein I8752_08320 [Nostocaceae cyanobacterium CENA369]|uniref:Uncharacterized protein n=1 Tax=Dendronalium phyllosphericum CENA369 TaxID=1725256 RepID=A0A8J7LCN5_9NOST|nr:hypothetical protein [Dendronalium phyllosphericum]MBH8573022.1 hypothetical protein [Dendronalium phyllosphericum CENA369]
MLRSRLTCSVTPPSNTAASSPPPPPPHLRRVYTTSPDIAITIRCRLAHSKGATTSDLACADSGWLPPLFQAATSRVQPKNPACTCDDDIRKLNRVG